jgi:hypothetical protein
MDRRESIGVVSAGRCPEAAGLMHARCLRFHPLWLTGSRPPSGGAVSGRLPPVPWPPVLPRPPHPSPPARPAVPCRVELTILRALDVPGHLPGIRPGGGQVMACLAANDGVPRRQLSLASRRCRRACVGEAGL